MTGRTSPGLHQADALRARPAGAPLKAESGRTARDDDSLQPAARPVTAAAERQASHPRSAIPNKESF